MTLENTNFEIMSRIGIQNKGLIDTQLNYALLYILIYIYILYIYISYIYILHIIAIYTLIIINDHYFFLLNCVF